MTSLGAANRGGERQLTRRNVLHTAAGLTFGLVVAAPGNPFRMAAAAAATSEPFVPNVWANIAPDGTITILAPADEMGQGSMTALPIIFAEELDADWDAVRIEFTPAQDEHYGNLGYYGLLMTEVERFGGRLLRPAPTSGALRRGVSCWIAWPPDGAFRWRS